MKEELITRLQRSVHYGSLDICRKVRLRQTDIDRYHEDMKQAIWVEIIKALKNQYDGSVKETSFLKVVISRAALQFLWKEKLVPHPQHKTKCVPIFKQIQTSSDGIMYLDIQPFKRARKQPYARAE